MTTAHLDEVRRVNSAVRDETGVVPLLETVGNDDGLDVADEVGLAGLGEGLRGSKEAEVVYEERWL